jgi:hypothetical protein
VKVWGILGAFVVSVLISISVSVILIGHSSVHIEPEGVCVVFMQDSGSDSIVQTIISPVKRDGVISCDSGQYVSVKSSPIGG